MSNTKYTGTLTLRLDEPERHSLMLAVMSEVEIAQEDEPDSAEDRQARDEHLIRLRAMLDRLSD